MEITTTILLEIQNNYRKISQLKINRQQNLYRFSYSYITDSLTKGVNLSPQ